jgi:hypothetical protein
MFVPRKCRQRTTFSFTDRGNDTTPESEMQVFFQKSEKSAHNKDFRLFSPRLFPKSPDNRVGDAAAGEAVAVRVYGAAHLFIRGAIAQ